VTTPLGFTALGWKYYLIWGASAALIIPLVYFFYPETTGLSMEEIDSIFIDSPGVLSTVSFARKRRSERLREAVLAERERFGGIHKPEVKELRDQEEGSSIA
jgi:hypothetical protein